MNKFRKKLLALLLVINFVGITVATTVSALTSPFYGMISMPVVVVILSAVIYISRNKIFSKKKRT